MLGEIDVTLVAARRPELLELTLRSFRQNLLRHLRVRRLYVNLDPIWGSEEDAAAVRALCRFHFDDMVFNERCLQYRISKLHIAIQFQMAIVAANADRFEAGKACLARATRLGA